MISTVTYIKSSGFIRSVVMGDISISMTPDLSDDLETISVDWEVDGRSNYVADGQITLRPEIDISALDGASSTSLPPLLLPSGTMIIVNGSEVGVADADPTEIVLPYAGDWYLEFRPPFPWMVASRGVTVS